MKQIRINIFDKISKKIAKDIVNDYNDVEYFNIENVENKYLCGILAMWDIRKKKVPESSKLTINNKLDFIISEINAIKNDVISIKDDVTTLKNDVVELKNDVAKLKNDVTTLKNDVAMLKSFHTDDIKKYLNK